MNRKLVHRGCRTATPPPGAPVFTFPGKLRLVARRCLLCIDQPPPCPCRLPARSTNSVHTEQLGVADSSACRRACPSSASQAHRRARRACPTRAESPSRTSAGSRRRAGRRLACLRRDCRPQRRLQKRSCLAISGRASGPPPPLPSTTAPCVIRRRPRASPQTQRQRARLNRLRSRWSRMAKATARRRRAATQPAATKRSLRTWHPADQNDTTRPQLWPRAFTFECMRFCMCPARRTGLTGHENCKRARGRHG